MNQKNKAAKNVIVVVYDGIANSVFTSQVVQPLINQLNDGLVSSVTLVSFESSKPSRELIEQKIPLRDDFHFALARKLPFWGVSSLYFGVHQLVKVLSLLPCDKLVARGPLAGFVAYKALIKNIALLHRKVPVIIQARGLCAEEFRYTWQCTRQKKLTARMLYQLKYRNFRKLEKLVFGQFSYDLDRVVIESVSSALSQYLMEVFGTKESQITIAESDKPKIIPTKTLCLWRQQIRKRFAIDDEQQVYCYSGSYKPWQCVSETIKHFALQKTKMPKSFLLILSQDAEKFQQELSQYGFTEKDYVVCSVKPNELLQHLAAADYGMLFRKKDVVNWVSRPTKMLEYQAAGLKIIHNNTIAWLNDI